MREAYFVQRLEAIIRDYSHSEPFHNYLKKYFRAHPEMGATDRRETRNWSYAFFRTGLSLAHLPFQKRLALSGLLCRSRPDRISAYLFQLCGLDDSRMTDSPPAKLEYLEKTDTEFSIEKIFPMHDLLSAEIRKDAWFRSMLIQPRVWIRMRKKFSEEVITEINEAGIRYVTHEKVPEALGFEADTKLDALRTYASGYFEIQDLSSQQTGAHFNASDGESWWDCCAGSGGKSLLLLEQSPHVNLFASDVRPVIMQNYRQRLSKAGWKDVRTAVIDLTREEEQPHVKGPFDGIIADVPCSGSGTWSRNPEWLVKDESRKVPEHYVPLQRKITGKILQSLKPGGVLVYCTCSALNAENEENIAYFINKFHLSVEFSAYLHGYLHEADTLYVARLRKIA